MRCPSSTNLLFRIRTIPPAVSSLKNIRGLYLSSNCIKEVPSCLSKCLTLEECYLDHNKIKSIPDSLLHLPRLETLSVSSNRLVTLPPTPSLSCCRILLDHNPRLNHLPYLLGCQQTILEYSNQASWATFPLARNTMDGVWNLKLSGCDQPGGEEEEEEEEEEELGVEPTFPVIITQSGKRLRFSDKLMSVWSTAEICVCSLKELCLKQVYGQVVGGIVMKMTVTEDVRLHLPSLSVDNSGCLSLAGLRSALPWEVWSLLSSGPAAHCCAPSCRLPIFQESLIQILQTPVQTGWPGGEAAPTTFLASRFYCHSACYLSHRRQPSQLWENNLHSREMSCRIEK